jgi:hypothetical protein
VKTRRPSGLLASILIGLLLAPTTGCTMQATAPFDSDTWKAQRGVDAGENRRGTMVDALERAVRVGMPRDQVVALLGEPDARDAATGVETYELGVSPVGVDEEVYEMTYRDGMLAEMGWRRR